MSRWAIIDLDGSISDCSSRVERAHAAKRETDPAKKATAWDYFHSACVFDKPYEAEILLIKGWLASGHRIVYLSGRSDKFRVETQRWLKAQNLPQTPLLLRPAGEFMSSVEYKKTKLDMIREHLLAPGDVISFVLEDQDRLVEMWRGFGLTCLQPRRSSY